MTDKRRLLASTCEVVAFAESVLGQPLAPWQAEVLGSLLTANAEPAQALDLRALIANARQSVPDAQPVAVEFGREAYDRFMREAEREHDALSATPTSYATGDGFTHYSGLRIAKHADWPDDAAVVRFSDGSVRPLFKTD